MAWQFAIAKLSQYAGLDDLSNDSWCNNNIYLRSVYIYIYIYAHHVHNHVKLFIYIICSIIHLYSVLNTASFPWISKATCLARTTEHLNLDHSTRIVSESTLQPEAESLNHSKNYTLPSLHLDILVIINSLNHIKKSRFFFSKNTFFQTFHWNKQKTTVSLVPCPHNISQGGNS